MQKLSCERNGTITVNIDDLLSPLGGFSTIIRKKNAFRLHPEYESIEIYNAFHHTIKIEKIDENNYKKMQRIDIYISDRGFWLEKCLKHLNS